MSNNHFLTPDGKWVTVSDDELYHWKYIKREKKNGKWVYYYDIGKNEKWEAGVTESAARDAKENREFHEKRYREIQDKVNSGELFDKDNGNASIVEPYRKAYEDAFKKQKAAESKAKAAAETYSKTPLAKLEQAEKKIETAKKYVSNLLSQTAAGVKSSLKTLGKKNK